MHGLRKPGSIAGAGQQAYRSNSSCAVDHPTSLGRSARAVIVYRPARMTKATKDLELRHEKRGHGEVSAASYHKAIGRSYTVMLFWGAIRAAVDLPRIDALNFTLRA